MRRRRQRLQRSQDSRHGRLLVRSGGLHRSPLHQPDPGHLLHPHRVAGGQSGPDDLLPVLQVHRALLHDLVHHRHPPLLHRFQPHRPPVPLHRPSHPRPPLHAHGTDRTLQPPNPPPALRLPHQLPSAGLRPRLRRDINDPPNSHVHLCIETGLLFQ